MKTMQITLAVLVAAMLLFSVGSALAMESEIVGTVEQNGNAYTVVANSGEYLAFGKDLKNYVGETVAATGKVYFGAQFDTIQIDSVKLVSKKDLINPELVKQNKTS